MEPFIHHIPWRNSLIAVTLHISVVSSNMHCGMQGYTETCTEYLCCYMWLYVCYSVRICAITCHSLLYS